MESLTLNEGTPYLRHYPSRDRRYCSPRLPTPDASRSSRETFESPYGNGSVMRTRPVDRSLGIPHETTHYRGDSRNAAAPHSPPYQNGEGQKPSLPPLKTACSPESCRRSLLLMLKQVLGNNISSPPRTPSPGASPGQLAPREPSYITSTYKPPSLYPNKKQRTEMCFPGVTGAGPRFTPSVTLEPRGNGTYMRPNGSYPPMESIDTRRASVQTAGSPPWSAQGLPPKPETGRSLYDIPSSHYHTPEQTPTYAMLEPVLPRANPFTGTAPDPFTKQMRDSFGQSAERPDSRRSSISNYAMCPPRPYEREQPRHGHWPSSAHPTRDGYADPRESIRYGRPDEHQTRPCAFPPHSYQSGVPAFFMPSNYEYQHGKARKRSNLPKQSTEIMKTWFDQNIANPYPSEEQKAIFSNATGISMTQVSNWFINHRRRCPELRDKRERSRGGSDP